MHATRVSALAALLFALIGSAGCVSVSLTSYNRMEKVIVQHSGRFFECNSIAIVDVDGFIGVEGPWTRAGTTVADLREKLDMAADDMSVRAVVLRIDSPGGAAAASDTMYHEVMDFKEKSGKPVVAALMGEAASGGYYVALSADRIVATPTTLTGSVGAIMNLTNVEGLFKILGLKAETIKSGERKDVGSPFRAMKPEERAILDEVVGQLAGRFLETVRSRRPDMTEEHFQSISDGRVVTAPQALELGLVDSIGYLEEAIDAAKDLAKVEKADVILYRSTPSRNQNIYAGSSLPQPGAESALQSMLQRERPALLYLWAPGLNP